MTVFLSFSHGFKVNWNRDTKIQVGLVSHFKDDDRFSVMATLESDVFRFFEPWNLNGSTKTFFGGCNCILLLYFSRSNLALASFPSNLREFMQNCLEFLTLSLILRQNNNHSLFLTAVFWSAMFWTRCRHFLSGNQALIGLENDLKTFWNYGSFV